MFKYDYIEYPQLQFPGRFIFSQTEDGRFAVQSQEREGLRDINIRGVRDVKEFRTKLKAWIRQNPDISK